MQLQRGILQSIGDMVLSELGANRANKHSEHRGASASVEDESADHHGVASLHKAAGGNFREPRSVLRIELVHFDQSNSRWRAVVLSAHNGGVTARLKCSDDSRFPVIARSQVRR